MFIKFISICVFTLWIFVGFAAFPYEQINFLLSFLWIFLGLIYTNLFSIFLNENIAQ
jgi:hypothetical protein